MGGAVTASRLYIIYIICSKLTAPVAPVYYLFIATLLLYGRGRDSVAPVYYLYYLSFTGRGLVVACILFIIYRQYIIYSILPPERRACKLFIANFLLLSRLYIIYSILITICYTCYITYVIYIYSLIGALREPE